jgi:hypothetical protein
MSIYKDAQKNASLVLGYCFSDAEVPQNPKHI